MTDTVKRSNRAVFKAPDDVAEDRATGHAVYDRTLGQFVGPVFRTDKPTADEAKALTGGHAHTIVRV